MPGKTPVFCIKEKSINKWVECNQLSSGMQKVLLILTDTFLFIITSHHPYIINKIPVENWFIFHRQGSEVSIRYGDWPKERFGKSKQQAFIQLINDPFYNKGIE